MRSEKQKMLAGELYCAADPELQAELAKTRKWLTRYNGAETAEERRRRLPERLGYGGKGAVAIWNDITPEWRAEFYAWHGSQHMPERAGIAGFLRGRRYVALEGSPEFFTLYETVSPRTVTSPDYLARLNDPTPWTK